MGGACTKNGGPRNTREALVGKLDVRHQPEITDMKITRRELLQYKVLCGIFLMFVTTMINLQGAQKEYISLGAEYLFLKGGHCCRKLVIC